MALASSAVAAFAFAPGPASPSLRPLVAVALARDFSSSPAREAIVQESPDVETEAAASEPAPTSVPTAARLSSASTPLDGAASVPASVPGSSGAARGNMINEASQSLPDSSRSPPPTCTSASLRSRASSSVPASRACARASRSVAEKAALQGAASKDTVGFVSTGSAAIAASCPAREGAAFTTDAPPEGQARRSPFVLYGRRLVGLHGPVRHTRARASCALASRPPRESGRGLLLCSPRRAH